MDRERVDGRWGGKREQVVWSTAIGEVDGEGLHQLVSAPRRGGGKR